MIPKIFTQEIRLNDGRKITIETGKLAKQAHGSVVVKMGDCMLLCTVVSNYKSAQVDFLPLTVDYREKFAAAGRYPGGFFKREARPSDGEVLTMRLVDRVLRPLFPKDYHNEVQVMIQLMSHDENVMPDALAGLAASAAIQLSDFPFECVISEARVARVEGELIINPSRAQLEISDIDIMVGASADSVMMVEGEMDECSEEEMVEAIKFAHEAIKIQIEAQMKLASKGSRRWKYYLNYNKLDQFGLPKITLDAEFKENEKKMKEDWKIQAAEMLEATGFSDVTINDSNAPIGKGIHEMGTARMGHDPKTSVLNKFNQIHAVKNVFVTDGACMTSAANQNPSLTYMALTARAVNHAVKELKRMNF